MQGEGSPLDKKVLWGLTACLIVLCLILGNGWRTSARECNRAQLVNGELQTELGATMASLDSLKDVIPPGVGAENNDQFWYKEAMRARENQGMLLSESEIGALKEAGLDNPPEQLRDELMSHPDLIPYEGVLGGTMGFVRHTISPLSPQWIYAEFEDGHVMGRCLLEYDITSEGAIAWTVIRAEVQ